MRLMFVCLGNICRSPLAEAVCRHEINRRGLDGWSADSSGTANYHVGQEPDPRTISTAGRHGVPIRHLGRQFAVSDFDAYDLILPMDYSNEHHIRTMAAGPRAIHLPKIKLLRSFSKDGEHEVPDPYYGDERDFEEVYEMILRSLDGLFAAKRE